MAGLALYRASRTTGAGGRAGDVRLSHRAAPAVSLGLEGLTTVFGKGTGGTPPL
jgi:hypothetical protein